MSRPSSKPNDAGADSERGFILVAVLWILSALAVLSAVYSVYVSNAAVAAHVTDDGVNAEAAVRAGVELAAYELTAAPESSGSAQPTAAQGSSPPAQPAAGPAQLTAASGFLAPGAGWICLPLGPIEDQGLLHCRGRPYRSQCGAQERCWLVSSRRSEPNQTTPARSPTELSDGERRPTGRGKTLKPRSTNPEATPTRRARPPSRIRSNSRSSPAFPNISSNAFCRS